MSTTNSITPNHLSTDVSSHAEPRKVEASTAKGETEASSISSMAQGAVTSIWTNVTSFFYHVYLGACNVIGYVKYIVTYPFVSHYTVHISPAKKEEFLKQVRSGRSEEKFKAFVDTAHLSVLSYGNVAPAKDIVKAFAAADKEVFGKIATLVAAEKKLKAQEGKTLSETILEGIESGQVTFVDLYHGLNFYRVGLENFKDEMRLLSYQIDRALKYPLEKAHIQKLLKYFAEKRPEDFARIAKFLSEVNSQVKAEKERGVEKAALEWIDSNQFSISQMRKAFDLHEVDLWMLDLADNLFIDQPSLLAAYLSREIDEEEQLNFIVKALISQLKEHFPQLMKDLLAVASSIKENERVSSEDVLKDCDQLKIALGKVRDMRVLREMKDPEANPTTRLHALDVAFIQAPIVHLSHFFVEFAKVPENSAFVTQLVDQVIEIDKEKAKLIAPLKPDASPAERQKAVLEACDRVGKLDMKEDAAEIHAFRGSLRDALRPLQEKECLAEMQAESSKEKKLQALRLIAFQAGRSISGSISRKVVEAFAQSEPETFGHLATHIVDRYQAHYEGLKGVAQTAYRDERHPVQMRAARQLEFDQRTGFGQWLFGEPRDLTSEEEHTLRREVYGTALLAYMKDSTEKTDFDWFGRGTSSFMAQI